MEKQYLDYNGLANVAGYVNTRLKTVTTMPVNANNGAIRLYVGETSATYTKGHIYQYNATDLEWVDITSSNEYTAGNGIDITDDEISVKVANATNGNLAGLDSNGNLIDSGVVADNVIEKVATATGLLRNDGTVDTSTYATTTQLASKVDKVVNATVNDFATLDSNGNLIDSGINKDIVPNTATSSNKLATTNDLPTELNDLSDDVMVTSPTNGQILKYNSTSGKWENQTEQPPVSGATFKGSILFANIPTTGMTNGDWYDIKDAFTTDNRFEEGAGIECTAGTDIIWVTDDSKWNILTPSGVNSFNGRVGAVVPAIGDYDANDIDYDNTTSGLTATNVQDAIDELESNKADNNDIPTAYTSNPEMNGTASAGTSSSWAKGDHVHPTDTSRASTSDLTNHINNKNNPHSVTASQVGLGSVVNTGDSATPVSGGTTKFTTGGAYTELNKKADKISNPTNGNFVGMDSNGNLTNSGSKASDFSTVKTRQTPTSGGTTLSLVNTGDMYTWNNKSTVSIANSGTASGTAYSQQNITINGTANMINGTRYMELTQNIQSSNVFTFSNSIITTNSVIDYYTSDFSVQPSNVSVAAGQCVVTVPQASSSKSLTVRIYIK